MALKAISARARALIDRARKHGVDWEVIEPEELFARDGLRCQCGCGLMCDPAVRAPHHDAPTVGHIVAMSNGGTHTWANVQTQRWACNRLQNAEVDAPTRAKWRRQARETGPQSPAAKAKKRPMHGRGFAPGDGFPRGRGFRFSKSFSGVVRRLHPTKRAT